MEVRSRARLCSICSSRNWLIGWASRTIASARILSVASFILPKEKTVASARKEIALTGRSTVVASITAEIRAGHCTCEIRNPAGICCLGEVCKRIKELQEEYKSTANDRTPQPAC